MHAAGWLFITSQKTSAVPLSQSDIGHLLGYIHARRQLHRQWSIAASLTDQPHLRTQNMTVSALRRASRHSCVKLLACVFC